MNDDFVTLSTQPREGGPKVYVRKSEIASFKRDHRELDYTVVWTRNAGAPPAYCKCLPEQFLARIS